jgi:hypothetical protein
LWWTKWHWGRFSPSTSVSPANSHSTDCSTLIIYNLGLVTIDQLVADVPSGFKSHPTSRKLTAESQRTEIVFETTFYARHNYIGVHVIYNISYYSQFSSSVKTVAALAYVFCFFNNGFLFIFRERKSMSVLGTTRRTALGWLTHCDYEAVSQRYRSQS